MSDLHFKFRDDADEATRSALLDRLKARGAQSIVRLFPDDDGELAGVYAVVSGKADHEQLLGELTQDAAVEFAEHAVKRTMIS